MPESIRDRIAEIYAAESRRVLATLIRLLGDIDQAEEALQEAFGAALSLWPRDGIPQNPRAWLVSTGKFKGIDAIRRQARGTELILQEAEEDHPNYAVPEEWDGDVVKDDQLRLIFTCCHPVLPIDARIALSLRVVCGLTTEEISRSFLVAVATMKKRISRAKATIRENGIPYEVPSHSELAGRLDAVLHVIYLVYNEGYSATSGTEHLRRDLAAEAVSLSRLVADLLPEPEATGLLCLVAPARVQERGADRFLGRPDTPGGTGPEPVGPEVDRGRRRLGAEIDDVRPPGFLRDPSRDCHGARSGGFCGSYQLGPDRRVLRHAHAAAEFAGRDA